MVRVHTVLESQGAGLIPARGPNVALFPTIPGLKLYVYTYNAHLEVQKKYWNVFLLLMVTFVKAVNALARYLAHCVVQAKFLPDCKTYNFLKQAVLFI